MKYRIIIIVAIFLTTVLRSAAQKPETMRLVMKYDSIGTARLMNGNYSESNDVIEKAVELLDGDDTYSPDSTLIRLLLIEGRNYFD